MEQPISPHGARLDGIGDDTLAHNASKQTLRAVATNGADEQVGSSCNGTSSSLDRGGALIALESGGVREILTSVASQCVVAFQTAGEWALQAPSKVVRNARAALGSAQQALSFLWKFLPAVFEAAKSFGWALGAFWKALPQIHAAAQKVKELLAAHPDLFDNQGIRDTAVKRMDGDLGPWAGVMMMFGFGQKAVRDAITITLSAEGWQIFKYAAQFLLDLMTPLNNLFREVKELKSTWSGLSKSVYDVLANLGFTALASPVLDLLRGFFERAPSQPQDQNIIETVQRKMKKMGDTAQKLVTLSEYQAVTSQILVDLAGCYEQFKDSIWKPLSTFVFNTYSTITQGFESSWSYLRQFFDALKQQVRELGGTEERSLDSPVAEDVLNDPTNALDGI